MSANHLAMSGNDPVRMTRVATQILLWAVAVVPAGLNAQAPQEPGRHLIEVVSSMDGSPQPSYLILPPEFGENDDERPVVVSLHSWSFGLEQRRGDLEAGVAERGWIYLFPNFRGRNDHVEACGSEVAKRDVIDALDWLIEHYPVDERRIYLTGISGGGFMTLAMAASYPERWAAASAWVPLADLRAWYDFHAGDRYGEMTRQCAGGDPAEDPAVGKELERRSPLHQLSRARGVALDISAGRFDGHDGAPIPVWHSLTAFNVIARAVGAPQVSEAEIAQLSRHEPRLDSPDRADKAADPSFGRDIFLRRHAGRARVTIFDGAHEGLASAAIAWFEAHSGG